MLNTKQESPKFFEQQFLNLKTLQDIWMISLGFVVKHALKNSALKLVKTGEMQKNLCIFTEFSFTVINQMCFTLLTKKIILGLLACLSNLLPILCLKIF